MSITSLLPLVLVIAHFVFTWIYVGIAFFQGNHIISVGAGLYIIVALQAHSLLFYLKTTGETLHRFLGLAFYVLAGAQLLFLIIVGMWAGVGPSVRAWGGYGAAIAFSVFDALVVIGMIVLTFFASGTQGGGYTAPPVVVTSV